MAEKIIHEVRFIETDDGFRIEVKGDKERIRKMGFGPGMGFGPFMGCGPGRGRGRKWRHGRKHGHGMGGWMWGGWGEHEDFEPAPESEEGYQKSPKEA